MGSHTFGSGVKTTVAESVLGEPGAQGLSVMGLREPLDGVAAAKVSSQVSASEPVRVITTGLSSSAVTDLSSAVGGSLKHVMSMVTVAGAEVSVPSLVV